MTTAAMGQAPSVLLPASLTDLDPAWKSCSVLSLGLGRDPPQALKPAKNMAPEATSHQAVPTAAQSVPYPHSMPKLPGPDPTSSSLPIEDRASRIPKDTVGVAAASLGKLNSVCSPVPRSRSDSSNSAGSQHPHIEPRDEAASTADRKTSSGLPLSGPVYVSATSAASYYSWVDAWYSELDSEASVLQVPPVAAANSYMALPKHRSKKRTQSSTMTGPTFPQNSSETRASPEQGASIPPMELPVLSATHPSLLSVPSAKAPTDSVGVPPPQSAPPASPDPTPAENENARYGNCDHDIVLNLAITTRNADIESSSSIQTSRQSTGLARSSTQTRNSLHRDSASLPASSFSSTRTVRSGLSSTSAVVPQASDSSYASLVASITGLSSSPTSSDSAGGLRISVAGCGSLRWIAAGLMFSVLLY